MRENIRDPGPELRLFPDPADVFVPDQLYLAEHLHPLVSIDLACVNPQWKGWIHLLSPLEPFDGALGDGTERYHGALQAHNTIGFRMEGDRYRMLGDVRFFLRATRRGEVSKDFERFRDEVVEHCEAEEKSYRAHRATYRKKHELVRLRFAEKGRPDDVVDVLSQLGGVVERGNWPADAFPIARGKTLRPISPAKNRFEFVAHVPGWHYRHHGADAIQLFFEPKERLALIGLEWG